MTTKTPDRRNLAPGHRALLERFERQVDPDGTLEPDERARRVAEAKTAYFTHLANKSAKARRKLAEERIVLTAQEVQVLGVAYALLDRIHRRHAAKLDRALESEGEDA